MLEQDVQCAWETLFFALLIVHTVILPDLTLKKWGLSNFAFLEKYIGTQCKKNF